MYRRAELPALAKLFARAIPLALKRLRDRAGHKSLRPAVEAIQQATGHSVSRAAISNWERGTMPQIDSVLFFLFGLGFTFRDFQDALEEALDEMQAAGAKDDEDPAAALLARLRKDPALRVQVREMIAADTADKDHTAETRNLLAYLDGLGLADAGDDNGNGGEGNGANGKP